MKYEITKEQILDLHSSAKKGGKADTKMREWFPDAFKTALEVGKWYKGEKNILIYITSFNDINNINGYGFIKDGSWSGSRGNFEWGLSVKCVEANESEVFEALKNEAFKRGFCSVGICFRDSIGRESKTTGKVESHNGSANFGITNADNMWIFRNGVWAEIIPTITKQEAEKQLGKKIIY